MICMGLGWLGVWAAPAAATVPAGFSDTLVASVGSPIALAFTPDGRLLVTTQGGALRVIQNDALLATPALTIPAASICTESERGLLAGLRQPRLPLHAARFQRHRPVSDQRGGADRQPALAGGQPQRRRPPVR